MSSWRECILSEITSILGDGLHGTPNYDKNGEYFFINGNNLSNGKIIVKSDTKRADLSEYKKYKKNLNDRTILVSINGTLGNIALYNNEKCILGKSACYFNVNDDVDKYFIKYVVTNKDFQEYIRNFATGTTIPNVSLKTMREYSFFLPPLEEQKAIAEVLSSLDDKINLLHRQNQTLESLAQTLFRQWFIEEAKEEWEIKFSDAPIQIIDGDRGNNYPKNSDFFTNEYCLFLSARNVTKNGFDFSDCQFITKERDELLRKGKLSRNDVVLTTRGTVGNIAYYHELIPFENIRINSGMVILRADETKISPLYLYILMKSPLFGESVIEHTSGSAQPQLPIRDLNNVSFILPPKNIYNKFMEQVKPIYSKVFSNQKQIQSLENLRNTLLPKLLSGEVRVKI